MIDPSAPTETVDIDPETGNFNSPAHPEVFSDLRPLPGHMQIEPLINVQKQRQIAGVIKAVVAGQHLANRCGMSVGQGLGVGVGVGNGLGVGNGVSGGQGQERGERGESRGLDKRLLLKCLKLSALDYESLQRIFGVYVD